MTRFIWGIDISGNLSYTDDTLKRFLSSENVKDGMKKSDVNCRKIVQDLRKKVRQDHMGFRFRGWMPSCHPNKGK
ncbi:MAG: sporulation protein YqfD [Dorea longicatena]